MASKVNYPVRSNIIREILYFNTELSKNASLVKEVKYNCPLKDHTGNNVLKQVSHFEYLRFNTSPLGLSSAARDRARPHVMDRKNDLQL